MKRQPHAPSLFGESGKGAEEVLNELSDQTRIPSRNQVDRASVEKFWRKWSPLDKNPSHWFVLWTKDLDDVTDQDLEDWIVSRLTVECYMDKSKLTTM